jgi:hypothetical protein
VGNAACEEDAKVEAFEHGALTRHVEMLVGDWWMM